MPVSVVSDNVDRIRKISGLGGNPFWSMDSDLVMANYLQPSSVNMNLKLELFERLVKYRPYPNVLMQLAILRSLNGDAQGGKEAMKEFIANYPDYLKDMVGVLSARRNETSLTDIYKMASDALSLYEVGGVNTAAGRIAAVMTVAAPVTRKALF